MQYWQPSASLAHLRVRAQLLAQLRSFFAAKHVLEIETPLLGSTSIPDPHIHSLHTTLFDKLFYLQTSPEFAMKRLLAAGIGSIYQICKAFRADELGRWHNPEFTLLEWYRVDFSAQQLLNEIDELLQLVLQTQPAQRLSYQECFRHYLDSDPLTATATELKNLAHKHKISIANLEENDKDIWLHLLMSHLIEPQLGWQTPVFIYDYPLSQAALARVNPHNPQVAERFEVYVCGIELANGFCELTDVAEQKQRFLQDLSLRQKLKLPLLPLDEKFLAALNHGLPQCSGVALGIDRLLMLKTKTETISEAMSFSIDRV